MYKVIYVLGTQFQLPKVDSFSLVPTTDKKTNACSRPLYYTLKFLEYKKGQKHEKKNLFYFTFFYATFQFGRYRVFKFLFFSSEVPHNRPKPFI